MEFLTNKEEVQSASCSEEKMTTMDKKELSASNKNSPPFSENKCAICLGPFENMSYTNSCSHKFCFTCIIEWSKVRHSCPLCKARFKSVIHTIRSKDDYDTYILPPEQTECSDWSIQLSKQEITLFLEELQRFSKTVCDIPMKQKKTPTFIYSSTIYTFRYLWSRSRGHATSEFRHNIYFHNLYVDPDSTVDGSGRIKECNPVWYRNNQAQTHHLVPWLSRELTAIMEHQTNLIPRVIELVIELIQLFGIKSKEFHEEMSGHTSDKTKHFQHEFYHFARSTYGIVEYDVRACYNENLVISSVLTI